MSPSVQHKPRPSRTTSAPLSPQPVQAAPKGAKPAPKAQTLSPLQILVALENDALTAPDRLALKHQAVNHPRRLLDVGHIFWIKRQGKKLRISALSSQSDVDKNSPFIQDIIDVLSRYAHAGHLDQAGPITLSTPDKDDLIRPNNHAIRQFHYAFPHGFYAPFAPHDKSGGLLFTRATAFEDHQSIIMTRLGQSYGAIWASHSAKPRDILSRRKKWLLSAGALIIIACGFIPVPVATLAPAEIVAETPFIVAAPFDGVMERINVAPNSHVEPGTVLASFVDTQLKNELQVAIREEHVAEARLRQASLSSFIDEEAKRNLAVAQAETTLAKARTQYAQDRFSKTQLTAPQDGIAIYSNPEDWAGRPVATGETIIEIANPNQILLKINAPLLAGEALKNGARVRVFMDADPLRPLEATIERASYYAAPTPDGQMAYETYARLSSPYALPRIGARGVAKIYGNTAPLIFWLFRRPIAAVRQFIGF